MFATWTDVALSSSTHDLLTCSVLQPSPPPISPTQVRATNLQELVYKNGQASITKATVSIKFDNTDKAESPLGYEQYDEITITRQVGEVWGGGALMGYGGGVMMIVLPFSRYVVVSPRNRGASMTPVYMSQKLRIFYRNFYY